MTETEQEVLWDKESTDIYQFIKLKKRIKKKCKKVLEKERPFCILTKVTFYKRDSICIHYKGWTSKGEEIKGKYGMDVIDFIRDYNFTWE